VNARALFKRVAPALKYVGCYLVCFAVFLSWTFPYEKLKERIVTTFNAGQRGSASPMALDIDDLDSSFVTGVKAKGVHLTQLGGESGKPSVITIDQARARISVLGLLVGNRDVSFKIEAFDGTVSGTFGDNGKQRDIELEFDGVDMARIEAIAQNIGFPLEGRLNGTLKLDLPEGKASKGNGTIALEVREMFAGTAKELTVKTPLGPFTLPRLKVGTFSVAGEAKEGVLKVTKIGATGGDVDVQGDGRVQLREVATDAHLDVGLKFKVNDAYRSKNDKTKLLFGTPGGKDKPMLEMDPNMGRAKTPDGYYQLRVSGTLAKPDVKPQGAVSGAAGTPGAGFNFK